MLVHIWIINGNDYERSLIIQDLSEFYSFVFIDELTKENSYNKIDNFLKKIDEFSLINCKKYFFNIGTEDSEEIIKIKTKKEIKYIRVEKSKLTNYLQELFEFNDEEEIKNIFLKNNLNIDSFLTKSITHNSIDKEKYEISKNLDIELYEKNKKDNKIYSFLFENNFGEKIFNLLNKLREYNCEDIEKIYDLICFLQSEEKNLKNIISILPIINYEKKNVYFASYYYYFIANLLNNYKINIFDNKEENKDNYQQLINNKKFDEIKKKINKRYLEEIKSIRAKITNKMNNTKKKLNILYDNYQKFIFDKAKENKDHFPNIITSTVEVAENLLNQLKDINNEYIKLDNINKNIEVYFINFFRDYLGSVSYFISSIKNTYNYFYERIVEDDCSDKENIDDFIDFIYYIINFNYKESESKLNEVINYFENYFSEHNYENRKWKDSDNNNFEINNGTLYQIYWNKEKAQINECKNYCLKLIEKNGLTKFQYSNQKYLWFLKFRKNNVFEKNKKIFLNFFQKIFHKKEIRNLMIEIFPILNENYFINEEFINVFFDKIRAYNFKPKFISSETISPMLDVFIKSYFDCSHSIENEICAMASYILTILLEFANYLKKYIYKKIGDSKYKKSIDLCNFDDIGEHLETLLFGKVVDNINVLQALYILNENNYNKEYSIFKDGFVELENTDGKTIDDDLKFVTDLLRSLNIEITESDIIMPYKIFNIKGQPNCFIIGVNKDKRGRPVDTNEIFKGTPFEFLVKKNK